MTRRASTKVLPEPALADTQADAPGIGGVGLRLARGGVDGDYGRTGAAHKRSSSLSTRRPFAHAGEVVVGALVARLEHRPRPRDDSRGPDRRRRR